MKCFLGHIPQFGSNMHSQKSRMRGFAWQQEQESTNQNGVTELKVISHLKAQVINCIYHDDYRMYYNSHKTYNVAHS